MGTMTNGRHPRPTAASAVGGSSTGLAAHSFFAAAPRDLDLARLACRPEDALHNQLLPGRVFPGFFAVAQGAIEHPILADLARPDDVHVCLWIACRRPFAE